MSMQQEFGQLRKNKTKTITTEVKSYEVDYHVGEDKETTQTEQWNTYTVHLCKDGNKIVVYETNEYGKVGSRSTYLNMTLDEALESELEKLQDTDGIEVIKW